MNKKLFTTLITCSILSVSGQVYAEKLQKPLTALKDNAPVVLSGTVGDVRSDEFDLIYETDKITVELDRFGWTGNETNYLIPGESITVSGFIDDDLFEGREIEAYNVRLNDSFVYYYTADDYPTYFYIYDENYTLENETLISTKGKVSNINGNKFTVTNNAGSIRVDVKELGYDPFDDDGLQKIEKGDEVYVYGDITSDFFDKKEIMANGIVELVSG